VKCDRINLIRHRARRGLTLIELSIGMLITSMVAGAASAFMLAVSKSWQNGQLSQSAQAINMQAMTALQNELRSAKAIGAYRPGALLGGLSLVSPSSLILWKDDTNGDGQVQFSELEMIEYNPSNQTIYKYVPNPPLLGLDPAVAWNAMTNTLVLTTFKLTTNQQIMSRHVDGVHFYLWTAASAAQAPTLEFQLYFKPDADHEQVQYGSASLRAPLTPP
jgi:prepilin-type N-terminal cleavage/methylation domain-containing protein